MKRSSNNSSKYSWPTSPLKRSTKKKKNLKKLITKLNKFAEENEEKSTEINKLKNDIIDLTNLD
jgi:uncharacterized protein YigA (DUF484 family)